MNVTVYTTPNCVQCEATKRWLRKGDVEFNVVDLTQDEESLKMVRELGHTAAPVVITDVDHWSGFRISKLDTLIAEIKSEKAHASEA
jgi:glutaredoxin-like protein NrdH